MCAQSNIKEDVVNELHKPARKNFKRRHVIIKSLNDLWQADLVEMIPYATFNKGNRYILVVINAFSKYVWIQPVKRKTAEEVSLAMENILKLAKTPKNLQTDQGKEFFNSTFAKLMQKYKINHYNTYSNLKASIVERANRTLKNLMWKQFSLQGNYKWLNILNEIVFKYNTTKHGTTGMKPIDITEKNEKDVLKSTYSKIKTIDPTKSKFKKGDYVRISKYREAFQKGYTPNYSNEIFQVKEIKLTNPKTYLLKDEKNEDILGAFYEKELQKVKHPNVYLVEKVLRKKDNKVYVKWLGMDKSHNSWILKSELV